ncbi:DMT family transporter [Photobacterium alginatilyticum]|uniref:DMT family transporter n=1 Tax=Photobacterium alginatilyticum TaxID=1775171 RepID=A0ABW9YF78_9GAMM|nr:DMT family transporter [Photobacterium alginatilyticum]NBI52432.1 DMT family transporter [Photobacterium alginatilyticum]
MTNMMINKSSFKSARTMGVSVTLMGALLMSLDPIFIRFSGVSGFDTAFLFGLFTAISMPIFIQLRDERGLIRAINESGWPVLLSGLLMLGSATGLVLSIKHTSIANTFVILSAAPALAAVFSWLLLGEVTKRSTWIAIVSVMIGIVIVVSGSFNSGNLIGDGLAVFAVTCLSLNQTLLRKYKNVSRMASVGFGGLFLAFAMFFVATPSTYSLNTWLIMGVMGLFTAPFGRVLSQTATRYITAPEVGMILMINTVLAPIWAFSFFNEIPPMTSVLGGSIILLTILIYAISTTKNEQ